MHKRFLFTVLSILIMVFFILYVNPVTAQNNCPNCTECPNCTDCLHCTDYSNCPDCPNQNDPTRTQSQNHNNCADCPNCTECPNCPDCPNQNDPAYAQYRNGSMTSPWFTDSDNFSSGPLWLNNPQEGVYPWFWQAYNGFDVTGIAPIWYTDPTNATYIPAWLDGSSKGPWWSSFILDEATESVSSSRFRSKSNNNMNYQYSSMAPPWVTDPDNFSSGPSGLNNHQEGVGPWFWQAYNGFDVTGIAPIWGIRTLQMHYTSHAGWMECAEALGGLPIF